MADTSPRVLLVEDDLHLAEILIIHLRNDGYSVKHIADGHLAMALVERGGWDAVILDLMLPRVDGLEICRRARDVARYTPIIIVSARGSELHRVLGLEMGADDYLPKPFSVVELLARLKALLRRVSAIGSTLRLDSSSISCGDVHIDRLTRQVCVDGRQIELTPREFELLHHFAQHPERVFSRIELLDRVWGSGHDGYEHTVNTHINRLRGKLEIDPKFPSRIVTVWGLGYKFCAVAPHRPSPR